MPCGNAEKTVDGKTGRGGGGETGAVAEGYDLAALWRCVDELTAELSAQDRRAVCDAVAEHVAQGWQPTHSQVTDLVAYASGAMSMAHYLTIVGNDRRAPG